MQHQHRGGIWWTGLGVASRDTVRIEPTLPKGNVAQRRPDAAIAI
jgi:hypothetical protein